MWSQKNHERHCGPSASSQAKLHQNKVATLQPSSPFQAEAYKAQRNRRKRHQNRHGHSSAAPQSQPAGHGFIVSFDWHLTLSGKRDELLPGAAEAVELVAEMIGHENIRLLSYSGWTTEQKTRAFVSKCDLKHIFTPDRLLFTRAKTGTRGKAHRALCLSGQKTWVHVDDRQDIVNDFRMRGLQVVGVNRSEFATALDAAKYIVDYVLRD
jgi:hypothetical protein